MPTTTINKTDVIRRLQRRGDALLARRIDHNTHVPDHDEFLCDECRNGIELEQLLEDAIHAIIE